jgi:hypothetical protein
LALLCSAYIQVSSNLKTTKTDEKNPIIDLLDYFNFML